MNPYTNNPEIDAEIKRIMDALRPELRSIIEDASTDIYIQSFAAKAGLTEEQAGDLGHEVVLLILGLTKLDEFPVVLMTELDMPPRQAFAVENWVTNVLLKNVLQFLKVSEAGGAVSAPPAQTSPVTPAVQAPQPTTSPTPQPERPRPKPPVVPTAVRPPKLASKPVTPAAPIPPKPEPKPAVRPLIKRPQKPEQGRVPDIQIPKPSEPKPITAAPEESHEASTPSIPVVPKPDIAPPAPKPEPVAPEPRVEPAPPQPRRRLPIATQQKQVEVPEIEHTQKSQTPATPKPPHISVPQAAPKESTQKQMPEIHIPSIPVPHKAPMKLEDIENESHQAPIATKKSTATHTLLSDIRAAQQNSSIPNAKGDSK